MLRGVPRDEILEYPRQWSEIRMIFAVGDFVEVCLLQRGGLKLFFFSRINCGENVSVC